MGKSAPEPPAAPDYVGAAQAQGVANTNTAIANTSLSNPNVTSPYGSQSVTYQNTGPNGDPQAYINQSLTPEAQQTLDAQQQVQYGLSQLGQQGLTTAQSVLNSPFQSTAPGLQTSIGSGGALNYGPSAGQYGQASGVSAGPATQTSPDLSGIAQQDVNAGTTGQAAILARLNPQIQQNNAANAQQLQNQGITQGSEAYNNAMRVQGQNNNDLYTQAALQGIGLDQSANQQGYNQALNTAGLYNQATGQNFSQGLAANQASNAAIGQNYSQDASSAGLYNQAAGQTYNQNLGAAQFGNQAALQSYEQQLAQYNQPLNEITALESGSQIQTPQFSQYTGSQAAPAPIANATAQQGQYAQDLYGQQAASANSANSGLMSLLGSAATAAGVAF